MPSLSVGELRHTLVLERQRKSAGDDYTLASRFEPICQVYGKVEGVGGGVYFESVQLDQKITHRITMRFRPRTDFDHISRGTQRFYLRRARDPDGRRMWLICEVEEIDAGLDLP